MSGILDTQGQISGYLNPDIESQLSKVVYPAGTEINSIQIREIKKLELKPDTAIWLYNQGIPYTKGQLSGYLKPDIREN